jgi:hypothetical protein
MLRIVTAVALLALVAGCSSTVTGPPPKPVTRAFGLAVPKDGPVVLRAGEHFKASAEVLGIRVGKLDVHVRHPCQPEIDGRWRVESEMSTAGLLAFFNKTRGVGTSTVNAAGVELVQNHTHIKDGDEWREYRIWRKKERYQFRYAKSDGHLKEGKERIPLGEAVFDTQTALWALKSWRAEVGELSYFYVMLGRRLWRADVTYKGERELDGSEGPIKTVLFQGTAHRTDLEPGDEYVPRAFSVWLTADDKRDPVRVAGDGSIGSVTFYLEGHSFDGECGPPAADAIKKAKRHAVKKAKKAKAERGTTQQPIAKPAKAGAPQSSASESPSASTVEPPPASPAPLPSPEDSVSPGSVSPGSVSPGSVSPGSVSPGSVSPGSVSPGSVSPGSVSPGSVSPGSAAPPSGS